jgi:cytosine/uracil/thiamine/allantoin permease
MALYHYAWFLSFLIAALVYVALMLGRTDGETFPQVTEADDRFAEE